MLHQVFEDRKALDAVLAAEGLLPLSIERAVKLGGYRVARDEYVLIIRQLEFSADNIRAPASLKMLKFNKVGVFEDPDYAGSADIFLEAMYQEGLFPFSTERRVLINQVCFHNNLVLERDFLAARVRELDHKIVLKKCGALRCRACDFQIDVATKELKNGENKETKKESWDDFRAIHHKKLVDCCLTLGSPALQCRVQEELLATAFGCQGAPYFTVDGSPYIAVCLKGDSKRRPYWTKDEYVMVGRNLVDQLLDPLNEQDVAALTAFGFTCYPTFVPQARIAVDALDVKEAKARCKIVRDLVNAS